MPRKTLPRIAEVAPGPRPLTLSIIWRDGDETLVDVSELIQTFALYQPLREDPGLFASVRLGEFGTDVSWTPAIDMSAATLWRLAGEQSGQLLSSQGFRDWRVRHRFTLEGAADALGISRRMITYYEQGKKPIPRLVALATRALDLDEGQLTPRRRAGRAS